MYAGLASLKLPSCYDHDTQNVDCPVCDPDLGDLAKEVPFSHHVNSTIVCGITGRIMNEDNSPMAFPVNGSVFSREVSDRRISRWLVQCLKVWFVQALEDMAAKNEGMVTCPRTGETCHFTELRKVYVS